jgi:hypothetical protein
LEYRLLFLLSRIQHVLSSNFIYVFSLFVASMLHFCCLVVPRTCHGFEQFFIQVGDDERWYVDVMFINVVTLENNASELKCQRDSIVEPLYAATMARSRCWYREGNNGIVSNGQTNQDTVTLAPNVMDTVQHSPSYFFGLDSLFWSEGVFKVRGSFSKARGFKR